MRRPLPPRRGWPRFRARDVSDASRRETQVVPLARSFTRVAPALLLLLACVIGCGKPNDDKPPPEVDYGKLPGLRATANKALREELARIEAEHGTPELLVVKEKIPDDKNVAAGLVDLFRTSELPSLREKANENFPPGPFSFNRLKLTKAIKFAKQHEDRRLKAREALTRPQCDFGLRHDKGWEADRKFVGVVRMCGRLEAFATAEQLFVHHNVNNAIEALRYQFRLAELLGSVKDVESRLEAAEMREEALRELQAIVKDERLQMAHLELLRTMVDDQLKRWPKDADAWIGDRAMGMYLYEIVRDGQLFVCLTPDELRRFNDEGTLEELTAVARDTADPDELFYLTTMRKLLERCDKAFSTRTELVAQVRKELKAQRDSPDYALVADRLLLDGLENALRLQAADRARTAAWGLALDLATGKKSPYQVNPLTERPYRVQRDSDKVSVWLDDKSTQTLPDVLLPVPRS